MTYQTQVRISAIALLLSLSHSQVSAQRLAEADTALEFGSCSQTLSKHKFLATAEGETVVQGLAAIQAQAEQEDLSNGVPLSTSAQYKTTNDDLDKPDADRPTVAGFDVDEVAHLAKLAERCYIQPDIDNALTGKSRAKHEDYKSALADMIESGEVKSIYFFGSDAKHNTHENMGMVIVEKDGKIRVCYHGTDPTQNLKDDGKLIYGIDPKTKARIHSGFLEHFYYSKYRVLEILETIAEDRGQSLAELSKDVTFTGHSLGASVATYAGYAYAKEFGMVNARVAAFAPCRVMDAPTAHDYDQIMGARTISLMQTYDPVTFGHFSTIFGSAHVGSKVYVPHTEYSAHFMTQYIAAITTWQQQPELAARDFYAQSKYTYNPLYAVGKLVPWARRQMTHYIDNPISHGLEYAGWRSTPTAMHEGAAERYEERKLSRKEAKAKEKAEEKVGEKLARDMKKRQQSLGKGVADDLVVHVSVHRDQLGKSVSKEYIMSQLEEALVASANGPQRKSRFAKLKDKFRWNRSHEDSKAAKTPALETSNDGLVAAS